MELTSTMAVVRATHAHLAGLSALGPIVGARGYEVHADEDTLLIACRFDDRHALLTASDTFAANRADDGPDWVDAGELPLEDFDALVEEATAMPFHAHTTDWQHALETLRERPLRPIFTMGWPDGDALRRAWARQLETGGLFVPGASLPVGAPLRIDLTVGAFTFPGNPATVVRPDDAGVWAEVRPGPILHDWFNELREHGQIEPPPQGLLVTRAAVLPFPLARTEDFFAAWKGELSGGTLFVTCVEPPEPRTRVTIDLDVAGRHRLQLDAEVVHRVTSGPFSGVGVALSDSARASLAEFEQALRGSRFVPTVLVIDDEALWRSTWTRLLEPWEARVITAADGAQGLQLLMDHFFEIDLVLLDLHMPELDGRMLLEKVRRLGGESALTVFLISAAPQDELDELRSEASLVLSKLEPLHVFERAVRRALELREASLAAA